MKVGDYCLIDTSGLPDFYKPNSLAASSQGVLMRVDSIKEANLLVIRRVDGKMFKAKGGPCGKLIVRKEALRLVPPEVAKVVYGATDGKS